MSWIVRFVCICYTYKLTNNEACSHVRWRHGGGDPHRKIIFDHLPAPLILYLIPASLRELLPHSPPRLQPGSAASAPHIQTKRPASDRPWRPATRAPHSWPQPSSEPTSCLQRPRKDLQHTHESTHAQFCWQTLPLCGAAELFGLHAELCAFTALPPWDCGKCSRRNVPEFNDKSTHDVTENRFYTTFRDQRVNKGLKNCT